MDIPPETLEKEKALEARIAAFGGLAVAYSGGVDSTYLADVAHETLGARSLMIIADSPSIPRSELEEAAAIARERGWSLDIIETHEFDKDDFLKNDGRRCYVCKGELFAVMREYAKDRNLAVVAYGETADDIQDATRLGRRAADEHRVVAPLQDVQLFKDEIRLLSRRRGLPTWNKASFACLASRVPVGTPLNREDLIKVERAEEVLKRLGFYQYRARHHGDICRIEIDPADFGRMLDPAVRLEAVRELNAAGYRYVTLDLGGYRMGGAAQRTP